MRIGINATCLNDRPSGAKQRFVGLYGALFRERPDDDFVVFSPKDCNMGAWFSNCPNVSVIQTPIPSIGRVKKFALGTQFWPSALKKARLDYFEVMHLPLIRPSSTPTMLTIHDIRGALPQTPRLERLLYTKVLRDALCKADRVITVSESMAQSIEAFDNRISTAVIYNGINLDDQWLLENDVKDFLERFDLTPQYLLAVGHLEVRKNYYRLIEALGHLRLRGFDIPLVIIGEDSGEGALLTQLTDRLGLTRQVRFLSQVSDDDLVRAYQAAALFVFASNYEGFGIPILEAMAARCPMVLSDLAVFREITQGKALYFLADDTFAIADTIERGLSDQAYRRANIAYGESRVKDFDFAQLAKQLARLYEYVD